MTPPRLYYLNGDFSGGQERQVLWLDTDVVSVE